MNEKELREWIEETRASNERYRRRIKEAQQALARHRIQLETATRKGIARIDRCLTDIELWQAIVEQEEQRISIAEHEIEECNSPAMPLDNKPSNDE